MCCPFVDVNTVHLLYIRTFLLILKNFLFSLSREAEHFWVMPLKLKRYTSLIIFYFKDLFYIKIDFIILQMLFSVLYTIFHPTLLLQYSSFAFIIIFMSRCWQSPCVQFCFWKKAHLVRFLQNFSWREKLHCKRSSIHANMVRCNPYFAFFKSTLNSWNASWICFPVSN